MSHSSFDLFAAGGRMGEFMRDMDWLRTELGAPETWPPSLKTMAGTVLQSGFPMCLYWGPNFVQIYNDPYEPILGLKHPKALGETVQETWAEVWSFVEPRFLAVRDRGETVTAVHQMLHVHRNGYPEETYFTFSYSPVRDENNRIVGLLNVVKETTEEVLSERRMKLLREMAAEAAKVRGLDQVYDFLGQVLKQVHPDLPFTLHYVLDAQGDACLKAYTGISGTVFPAVVSAQAGSEQGGIAEALRRTLSDALASGHGEILEDADGAWVARDAVTGTPVRQALVAPLDTGVDGHRPGFLVLGISPHRALNEEYRGFLALVVRHVETALHNALAYETERKSAQAKLAAQEQSLQSQKMEAIGKLAGGIAHDFNNLLTAINGFSELSIKVLDGRSEVSPYLLEIHKAGKKAASLTNQLLAYSRKQIVAPRSLDLRSIVADMDAMLRRVVAESITFVKDIPDGEWIIRADKAQVEQALMNLVLNAADVMPHGGRLSIAIAGAELGEAQPGFHLKGPPGHYVVLSVADEGWGMGPEILTHLFEPFFTTKEKGKGTGLGLATVHGILKQTGGAIRVDSAPKKGTRFHLYFPRAKALEPAEPPMERPSTESRRVGQGRIVLLVEDEASVRGYVAACLRSEGYRVWEAPDGRDAIRMFQSRLLHVDLLLTDVVMPNMGGRELAEWFHSERPDGRILFMSGYTEDDTLRRGIRDSKAPFLAKPFSGADLSAKVQEVLEGVPGRLGSPKSSAAASSRA